MRLLVVGFFLIQSSHLFGRGAQWLECQCAYISVAAVTLSDTLSPGCSWGIGPADHVLWHPLYTHTPSLPSSVVWICKEFVVASVCMKSPRFLCQTVHLTRRHSSAYSTNCSAHWAAVKPLRFISVTRAVHIVLIFRLLSVQLASTPGRVCLRAFL